MLGDLSALRLVLDERAVGQVQVGQTASVYADSKPEHERSGRVAEIAPRVLEGGEEPGLLVWVDLEPGGGLVPGQRVTVLLAAP